MNFSKLLHEFVKVVLGTERLHRILNHTYSKSLWRWLFKSEVGTQLQRQRQWQGQWQRRRQTLKVHISYPGHAQSHIVHLVRFLDVQVYLINEQSVSRFSFKFFFCQIAHLIMLITNVEVMNEQTMTRNERARAKV